MRVGPGPPPSWHSLMTSSELWYPSDGCIGVVLGGFDLSLWNYLRQSRGWGLQLGNQVGMSALPFINCVTLGK